MVMTSYILRWRHLWFYKSELEKRNPKARIEIISKEWMDEKLPDEDVNIDPGKSEKMMKNV